MGIFERKFLLKSQDEGGIVMFGGIPMLKSFKANNAFSFYDDYEVSMVATGIKTHKDSLITCENNEHVPENLSILPVLSIYGANASGKTNLLRTMLFAFNSINGTKGGQIFGNFFKGIAPSDDANIIGFEGTKIDIVFLLNKDEYKFTFHVIMGDFLHETLLYRKNGKGRMLNLYNRVWNSSNDTWKLTIGETIAKQIKDEISYVSSMEQDNANLLMYALCKRGKNPLFLAIADWSSRFANEETQILPSLGMMTLSTNEKNPHFKILNDEIYKKEIIAFLQEMNPRIQGYNFEESKNERDFQHTLNFSYDKESHLSNLKNSIDDALSHLESRGIYTSITLLPSILVALKKGGLVIVDEMENSLHPLLMLRIIGMFTNPDINTGGGQLIFTTHNTLVMDKRYLRQDEIGFVERHKDGASEFYKLSDIDGVRSDLDFCKNYILGAFGAVPK